MNRTPQPSRIEVLLLFLFVAAVLALPVSAQSTDIAVVVSSRNPVSNVTLADLRKLFGGEKRTWPDGGRVKLIVWPPGSHERKTMLRLLGMSESEYKQYWTAQVFRGDADAEPVTVPSFGMVKEAIKVFSGAIAFVDAQDVKPGMDIKVLKVDGHFPGEPGYPLQ
jgi:ABC-type phosphate transport system substrate-binding protein